MYEETLIHLVEAYLSTNYITAEDICNCLGYGPSDTEHNGEIYKMIDEAITPMRDGRLQDIQDHDDLDDGDLEIAAKLITKRIEQIRSDIYRKRGI